MPHKTCQISQRLGRPLAHVSLSSLTAVMDGAKTVIFAATGNNYAGVGSSYDVDYQAREFYIASS